jgi:hypothetical protein
LLQSAEFIFEQIADAIEKLGPEKLVQVCTDSAANCKAAGALIMERYVISKHHAQSIPGSEAFAHNSRS